MWALRTLITVTLLVVVATPARSSSMDISMPLRLGADHRHTLFQSVNFTNCANESQAEMVLNAVYNVTLGGTAWNATNWTSTPVCQRRGVSCSPKLLSLSTASTMPGGALSTVQWVVTGLKLSVMPTRGTMHGSINQLMHALQPLTSCLVSFDTGYSPTLSGTLPNSRWLNMTRLTVLSLNTPMVSGELNNAWLSNITSLQHVRLLNGRMSGTIPSPVSSLHSLYLHGLPLVSGTVPQLGSAADLTDLSLSTLGVSGSLPSLPPALQFLQLSSLPLLRGSIPADLCSRPSLQVLSLYNVPLGGELPALENCTDLRDLEVSVDVEGSLPALTSPNLQRLVVSSTRLSGTLPALAHLTLAQLSIDGCTVLSGTLPSQLGTSLKVLHIADNPLLSGPFPNSLTFHQLLTLEVFSNSQLSGTLPSDWSALAQLTRAAVYGNQRLSGHAPQLVPSGLWSLELGGAKVSGTLALAGAHLSALTLDSLLLVSGTIPSLQTMQQLEEIELHNLPLVSGPLLAGISGLPLLRSIDVSACPRLQGTLPALMSATKLQMLSVSGMPFLSGQIPLVHSTQLTKLVLHTLPSLTGTVPALPPSLEHVDLHGNQRVSGTLSPALGQLARLQSLYVDSCRRLSGTLPSLSGLQRLSVLSLSNCSISGGLPASLATLPALTRLVASYNRFNDSGLPPEWCSLQQMEVVDLSHNSLSGTVLPSPCGARFAELDISHNQFTSLGGVADLSNHMGVLRAANNRLSLNQLMNVCPFGDSVRLVDLSNNVLPGDLTELVRACLPLINGRRQTLSLDVSNTSLTLACNDEHCLDPLAEITSLTMNDIVINANAGVHELNFDSWRLTTLRLRGVHSNARGVTGNPVYLRLMDAPVLTVLDLSNVSLPYFLCRTLESVPPSVELIALTGVRFDTLPCVHGLAMLSVTDEQASTAYPDSGLICRRWRFGGAGPALLQVDSDYMHYRSCECEGNQYWGPTHLDATTVRSPALIGNGTSSAGRWKCRHCPDNVHCDPTTVPMHCLQSNVYPIYLLHEANSDDPYMCVRSALQRVIFAHIVRCRARVCNVQEQQCMADQRAWQVRLRSEEGHLARNMSFLDNCMHTPGQPEEQLFPGFRCQTGHDPQSFGCEKCLPGYFHNGSFCVKCIADDWTWAIVLVWLAGVGLLLVYLFFLKTAGDDPNPSTVPILMGVWFMQMVPVVADVGHGQGFWEPLVLQLTQFHPWAASCVIRSWTWNTTSWLVVLSPFEMWALVRAFAWAKHDGWLALKACMKRLYAWMCCRQDSEQAEDDPEQPEMPQQQQEREQQQKMRRDQRVLATICGVSFCFVPTLRRSLQVLVCDDLDIDVSVTARIAQQHVHRRYLRNAPWVSCIDYDGGDIALGVAASVGLATCLFWLVWSCIKMWRSQEEQAAPPSRHCCKYFHKHNPMWAVFGKPYEKKYWYWYSLALVFNGVLVMFDALFNNSTSPWPMRVIVLLLLVQLAAYARVMPFRRPKDDWLMVLLCLLLFVLSFFSMGLNGEREHDVVLMQVIYITALGGVIVSACYEHLTDFLAWLWLSCCCCCAPLCFLFLYVPSSLKSGVDRQPAGNDQVRPTEESKLLDSAGQPT